MMFFGLFCLINTSNQSFGQMLVSNTLPNNTFCSINATITNNSVCRISWSNPFEWYYDDGTSEDFVTWTSAGGESVVKFVIPTYQIRLTGAKIYVGDGSFPAGVDFLDKDILLVVYDNDGEQGLPGTLLDSVRVTVNNYNWVSCEGMDINLEGVFYLGVRQIMPPEESAPIGVDTQLPTMNLSYVKPPSGSWQISPYQDFMIRAESCDSNNKRQVYQPQRNYVGIVVARISDFDPTIGETPDDGVLTVIDSLDGFSSVYSDSLFATLPQGYYAYGLKKINPVDSTFSEWNYSNTVLNTVGIVENEAETSFTMYPNPAKSKLFIGLNKKNNFKNTIIEIIDVNGKTVLKAQPFSASTRFNIKDLKQGLYIVKVQEDKTLNTKRLIIEP